MYGVGGGRSVATDVGLVVVFPVVRLGVGGDVTGDRVADFEIRMEGLTSFTASDFLL